MDPSVYKHRDNFEGDWKLGIRVINSSPPFHGQIL